MESVFSSQFLGLESFDGFTPALTPVQQAQTLGAALDQGFKRHIESFPDKAPVAQFKKYFDLGKAAYIRAPRRDPASIQIATNAISVYALTHPLGATSEENAAQIMAENGMFDAKFEGAKAVAMARAAFAIASRAGETHMHEQGIMPSYKPGVLNMKFDGPNLMTGSEHVVGALGKFIEPRTLREGLATAALTHPLGRYNADEFRGLQMDSLMPGKDLAEEAALMQTNNNRTQLIRNVAIKNIKFQHLAPHYSQLGSTQSFSLRPALSKDKIRVANGFKPAIIRANRFAAA